jgi:hypothetical protein
MRTSKIAEIIKCTAGNKRPHSVNVDKLVTCNNTKIIIKQNRTGQDRTGQDRTGQDRTQQNRPEQNRTEQNRVERKRTE